MPKILIADDEPGVLATLKQYFELAGYTVYTAADGNDVLELVPVKPDIFLLDINMPNMDGLTVCRRIRQLTSAPILFLTARVENSDKVSPSRFRGQQNALKNGMNRRITQAY